MSDQASQLILPGVPVPPVPPELPDSAEGQVDPYVQNLGWGDDPADAYRKLLFKMKVGQKSRISILSSSVHKGLMHFQKLYYFCLDPEGKGKIRCPGCEAASPTPRYMSWIFVYNVGGDGQALRPPSGYIRAWAFGRDKYGALSGLYAEYKTLQGYDLLLECTEEKFQRFSIMPAQSPALFTSDATLLVQIPAMLQEVASKVELSSMLGRHLTADRIVRLYETPEQQLANRAAGLGSPGLVASPRPIPEMAQGTTQLGDLLKRVDDIQRVKPAGG